MLAAVLDGPGKLEMRDVARPEPAPGELVVAVRAALTCGTDLKTYVRGHPKFPTPTPLGHEGAGVVVAAGAGVEGFREGDEVMFAPTGPCGECLWCRRGQENLCETLFDDMVLGTYAEAVRVPARVVRKNVLAKPEGLSWPQAALLEPLACVAHALEPHSFREDDVVVLLGGGGFTLLFVLALRAAGVRDVWVVARRENRREAALALGATRVFATDATGVEGELHEATGGLGADWVVECTGQPAVWEAAPRLARRGGTAILFGGCKAGSRVTFEASRLHYDQVEIRSPFHLTPRSVRKAAEWIEGRLVPEEGFFSGTYPLAQVPAAIDGLRQSRGIKYVIEP